MASVVERRSDEVSAFLGTEEYRTKWDVHDALMTGAELSRRYLHLVMQDGSVNAPLDIEKGARPFRSLFVYGYFGIWDIVTRPTEVPKRLEAALAEADEILACCHPDAFGMPAKILELARGRQSIDNASGGITPAALATLAGVTERHINNLMSKERGFRTDDRGLIDVREIDDWLISRPAYRQSVWQLTGTAPAAKRFVLLPQASDGTIFCPALRRRSGYTVGAKGNEQRFDDFDEALRSLREMAPPRWRRPNDKSAWGVVTGAKWIDVPEHELSVIGHDHFSKG